MNLLSIQRVKSISSPCPTEAAGIRFPLNMMDYLMADSRAARHRVAYTSTDGRTARWLLCFGWADNKAWPVIYCGNPTGNKIDHKSCKQVANLLIYRQARVIPTLHSWQIDIMYCVYFYGRGGAVWRFAWSCILGEIINHDFKGNRYLINRSFTCTR